MQKQLINACQQKLMTKERQKEKENVIYKKVTQTTHMFKRSLKDVSYKCAYLEDVKKIS